MKTLKAVLLGVAIVACLICVLAVSSDAGDSCCSDRAVMGKGIQAAYRALLAGAPDDAAYILEEAAEATGLPLPTP